MFGRRLLNPHRELEGRIGYRFRRKAHLEVALTHRSFRFENRGVDGDNQRLEFLGDAVLGFVAAAHLFDRLGQRNEGALTTCRSLLTSERTLAEVATGIDLGRFLRMGRGEAASGGSARPSTLADALEAVIGAAFIDGGLKAAERVFRHLFASRIDGIEAEIGAQNPKGKLQEYAQKVWRCNPVYRVTACEGPPHARTFVVEVTLPSGLGASGKGASKREAEMQAAQEALDRIEKGRGEQRGKGGSV